MTLYQKILYELTTKSLVSKTALRALTPHQRFLNKAVRQAKDNGHIKESSYVFRQGRQRMTVDYLQITQSGLKHLCETAPESVPWIKYASAPVTGKLAVIGSGARREQLANRFLKMSTIAVMADCIGAEENVLFCSDYALALSEAKKQSQSQLSGASATPPAAVTEAAAGGGWYDDDDLPFYLDDDEDEFADYDADGSPAPTALPDIVKQARNKFERECSRQFQNGSSNFFDQDEYTRITFMDALTVKHQVSKDPKGSIDMAFKDGRYCGILDSHFQTVLVYAADRMHPLVWYYKHQCRDLIAYDTIRSKLPGYTEKSTDKNAVLLVPDVKAFKATYEASEAKRIKYEGNEHRYKTTKSKEAHDAHPLGKGFGRFWIIPVSYEGARELEDILKFNPMVDEMELIPRLLQTMRYMTNSKIDERLFPLRDWDGALVTVQPHLDVPKMTDVSNYMTRFGGGDSGMKFVVICYEWQEPYWKAIIPDIEIRLIENEIDGIGLRRFWTSIKPGSEKFWIEKLAEAAKQQTMPEDAEMEWDLPM